MAIGTFDAIVSCQAIVSKMLKNMGENIDLLVLPAVATALMCFRGLDLSITPACDRIPDIHNVL